MNYDDMPAGPEMDRLIAEGVMGWALTASGHHEIDQGNWIDANGEFRHCGPNSFLGLTPFRPSANIVHAMEVLGQFDTYVIKRRWDGGQFDYEVSATHFKSGLFGVAVCEALPLAICRAALKASLPTNHAGRETP